MNKRLLRATTNICLCVCASTVTIAADISLGHVSGFNQNASIGVWKGVKFRKRERDGQKDCKKCIRGSMLQSCLWTLHSRRPFYSGEKLVAVHEGVFKQQHCHTWLIHFRQSLHPISAPKGLVSCHTAPEYLNSASGSCTPLCSTLSYLCLLRLAWMYSSG